MKLSADLHQALSRINLALFQQDGKALEAVLETIDLNSLLNQETIAVARGLGKTPLVLFLSTLAFHNDIDTHRSSFWLSCYQSIVKKSLDPAFQGYSRENVLRVVLESLINDEALTHPKANQSFKGSDQAWLDAIELAIDHMKWGTAETLLGILSSRKTETKTWLQISRCLAQRHPLYVDETGIRRVDVDYLALANLYSKCNSVAEHAKIYSVTSALHQLTASALEMAGEYDLAVKTLSIDVKSSASVARNVDIARCLCKKGDLLGSINHLDEALSKLLTSGKKSDLESDSIEGKRASDPVTDKRFDILKASQALSDLTKISSHAGVPIFLVSGTLLGYVRENNLLAHDKDIDVGIIGWELQFDLCRALQESGQFNINPLFLRGHQSYYIPIQHIATGMWIDIFVYHQKADKLVTGVDFFFGYRQTFSFTQFELKEIDFLGVKMTAPRNAELNLVENYGQEWRTPDPSYISHLESPSTDNKGGLPYMMTARLQAIAGCLKGKKIQADQSCRIDVDLSAPAGRYESPALEHVTSVVG